MAADEQDPEQKTEQPTQKRLEEAFRKGNVPISREAGNFAIMVALAATVTWFAPPMLMHGKALLLPFLADADSLPVDRAGLGHLLSRVMFGGMGIIAAPLIAAVVGVLAANFMQHGVVWTVEPVMPRL
ncbi:MAG: EscU/YscU/HrcU family type III secretion system export apparatus switch protein, partial [Pseudomonadota bacterium]|nr:EscU/YscU/HrcU family type III secretion system export apparatus switch protein [Pseudomonadota bacterium]